MMLRRTTTKSPGGVAQVAVDVFRDRALPPAASANRRPPFIAPGPASRPMASDSENPPADFRSSSVSASEVAWVIVARLASAVRKHDRELAVQSLRSHLCLPASI